MSTVPNVGGTQSPQSGIAPDDTSAQELSDRFLTMLTAQMSNQDPLNPLDNAEITSQLAQISTVTGISQLNSTMQWLGYSMGSLQSTQSASLIGRKVLMTGSDLELADGTATGGYQLDIPVERAEVAVRNADGTEVARFQVAGVDAGTHVFQWDGRMANGDTAPDGSYTFEVDVGQDDDVGVAPSLMVAQIAAVRPYAGGTSVIDEKGNVVNLSDVYQVW
ncbi:flagellar hook assembly protein FlgD [Pigmentiphaga soli]|uniref:Basal-body rod modification protein FlgD n=1 Tax=Pigmentiphaga soli TaxID=1007095 RepID=A0ABP8GNU4_9BURK